jgi:rRNA maturation RNase YbeY
MGLTADVFISIDRVKENAQVFKTTFEEELRRVMIHGVLHLMGLSDSNESEKLVMRQKEDNALSMFHVKP